MANWITKWITHPDYPGWHKPILETPEGMTLLKRTYWRRIPGSDPNLPPPPQAEREERERRGLPILSKPRPPWGGGSMPKLSPWKFPEGGAKPYSMPDAWDKIPESEKGRHLYSMPEIPINEGRKFNMPSPYPKMKDWLKEKGIIPIGESWGGSADPSYPKKTLEHMVPLGGGGGGINPPWAAILERINSGSRLGDLNEDVFQGKITPKEGYMQGEPYRTELASPMMNMREINPPWANMLKPDMTRDITIPPARRRNIRGTVDPTTGQNRLIQGGPTYPDQSDNFKKMQEIQEAYFSGADFGYEEGWPERLEVSEQMINVFMSTPEEAIIFAFENPTDAVLEEFERNYGWPLNVNSPALREYVMKMKGQNGV